MDAASPVRWPAATGAAGSVCAETGATTPGSGPAPPAAGPTTDAGTTAALAATSPAVGSALAGAAAAPVGAPAAAAATTTPKPEALPALPGSATRIPAFASTPDGATGAALAPTDFATATGGNSCRVTAAAIAGRTSSPDAPGSRVGGPAGISGRVTGMRRSGRSGTVVATAANAGVGAAVSLAGAAALTATARPARGVADTGMGRSWACSGRSRQRSPAPRVGRLAKPAAGPIASPASDGSSATPMPRFGTGRSTTGADGEGRRVVVAGVVERRDESSRKASRAPQAGHAIPVVPATVKRAAHLGQMIVIDKIPPRYDYITRASPTVPRASSNRGLRECGRPPPGFRATAPRAPARPAQQTVSRPSEAVPAPRAAC